MSILLETTVGDLVIDLDLQGSPALCTNLLKLTKARYYTNTLIYNIQPGRFCQLGDPRGDGTGGGCIHGLLEGGDLAKSQKRFLKSKGRVLTSDEKQERGRVVAVEMNGVKDTIGSQFLITLTQGPEQALDGLVVEDGAGVVHSSEFLSLGVVAEDDDNVLDKIRNAYCDANGRPYADIRIIRALVIEDPFDDPPGFEELLQKRGVVVENNKVTSSPEYKRPSEEVVEHRIQADEVEDEDEEETQEKARAREEEIRKREDKSRAVVLEMLGDLPSAEIKAPENVLFVCKLNPVTDDEDLELIFARFDQKVKAEIIRDPQTGASLQYAFVEFSNKQQCVEAYFKMNNALIDDRRIKVDFSQSVAKVWDKYAQKARMPKRLSAKQHQQQQHGGPRGGQQREGPRGGQYSSNRDNRQARPPPREGYREAYREDRRGPPPQGNGRDQRNDRNRWGPAPSRSNGGDRHQESSSYGRDDRRDEYGRARHDNGRDRNHGRQSGERRKNERGREGEERRDYERSRDSHEHRDYQRHRDGNGHRDHKRHRHGSDEHQRDRSRSRSPPSSDSDYSTTRSDSSDRSRSRKRRRKHRHHKHDKRRKHRRHRDDDERHHKRHDRRDRKERRRHDNDDERRHRKKRYKSRSRSISRNEV